MKVKISDITVQDRQRKHFDEKALDQLATSLATIGQIQPIVIDENNRLVCGERRLRAAKLNGWSEIDAKLVQELDEFDRQIMEFEENIRRENVSIAEEVASQKKLHGLYQKKYGDYQREDVNKGVMGDKGWSQRNTAELLGITEGWLSINLKIADAIEKDQEIGKLKSRNAMNRVIDQNNERVLRQVMAALVDVEPPPDPNDAIDDEPVWKHRWLGKNRTLYQADSRILVPTLEPESVDLVLTDPLWDVQFDEEIWNDDQAVLDVFTHVMEACYDVMKDTAHGFLFFAMRRYTEYYDILNRWFHVDRTPLIWYKPKVGWARDQNRQIRADYEPCFHFTKGDGQFLKPLFAVHMHPKPSDKLHPAQKPSEMLCALIDSCTVEGELVLDPFMGCGSTIQAANLMGRRSIGIDINQDCYNTALLRAKGGD